MALFFFLGRGRARTVLSMDDADKTPQQRLDENPELLAQLDAAKTAGREGTVPRRDRAAEELRSQEESREDA